MSEVPTPSTPGEVGPRIGARFIDLVIVFVVANIVDLLLTGGGMYGGDPSYGDTAIAAVVGAVIYLAYFAVLESARGQTVGKMLLKLRTVGPEGGNPTLEQALKRNLWTGLGILGLLGTFGSVLGGLLFIIVAVVLIVQVANDADGRTTFMDQFAGGTRVVG